MMTLPRVLEVLDTAPVVSLNELKSYIKVDFSADDALIPLLVEAATCACEKWTGLYFRRKRVEWAYTAPVYRFNAYNAPYDCLPTRLPYGPNQEIITVTRVDSDGTETELTTDQYTQSGYSFLSLTTERSSSISTYGQSRGYLKVEYKAGYHQEDADPLLVYPLDQDAKQAIALLTAELYENRQISTTGTIVATLDVTHKTLLSPYRQQTLF